MRILVCSKRDFPGCYFLNRLLPRLAGHDVSVWLSAVVRSAEIDVPELSEIAFVERTLFADDLFPIIDRLPASERQGAALFTFRGLSERFAIEISTSNDVHSAASLEQLGRLAPDLIVSARFSHLFSPAALARTRHGIVNLHPGALPRFAGLFAPMRTVCAGLQSFCGTLHWIDEGVDTGPILDCRTRPIARDRGLLPQVAEIYCDLIEPLQDLMTALARGIRPPGSIQDQSLREYRSLPSPAEIARFRETGMVFWKPQELSGWIRSFLRPAAGGSISFGAGFDSFHPGTANAPAPKRSI